jgi:hypothetical protein
MKDSRTPPPPRDDATAALHFEAGSALREFMAGRLGTPTCWPNNYYRKRVPTRGLEEASSIQRWETEGGRTTPATALSENSPAPTRNFHATKPLLTQLI